MGVRTGGHVPAPSKAGVEGAVPGVVSHLDATLHQLAKKYQSTIQEGGERERDVDRDGRDKE